MEAGARWISFHKINGRHEVPPIIMVSQKPESLKLKRVKGIEPSSMV